MTDKEFTEVIEKVLLQMISDFMRGRRLTWWRRFFLKRKLARVLDKFFHDYQFPPVPISVVYMGEKIVLSA